MHRFFASPDRCSASVFNLCESEARHASQVLRLEPGDRVEILDGQGTLIEAEILSSNRKSVEVRVIQRLVQPRPVPGVVLLQSLLKGKALDTVLEKSVELGVGQLVLLDTERCVARVPASEAARKRTVWTQTLIEAAKQSRNACWAPCPWPMRWRSKRPPTKPGWESHPSNPEFQLWVGCCSPTRDRRPAVAWPSPSDPKVISVPVSWTSSEPAAQSPSHSAH
jgi:hypothetical protein